MFLPWREHGYLLVLLVPELDSTLSYWLLGHHRVSKGLVTWSRVLDDHASSFTEKIEAYLHERPDLHSATNLYPPHSHHTLTCRSRKVPVTASMYSHIALVIYYSVTGLEFLTASPFPLMVTYTSFVTSR